MVRVRGKRYGRRERTDPLLLLLLLGDLPHFLGHLRLLGLLQGGLSGNRRKETERERETESVSGR
jgi:hypothetical protein